MSWMEETAKICREATPPPWEFGVLGGSVRLYRRSGMRKIILDVAGGKGALRVRNDARDVMVPMDDAGDHPDVAFITTAPEALPFALERLEEAEKLLTSIGEFVAAIDVNGMFATAIDDFRKKLWEGPRA